MGNRNNGRKRVGNMRSIKEFVGSNNFKTVQTLVNWINDCYRNKDSVDSNYAILQGDSGNGKTFLVQLLADVFHLQLYRITPFDIESGATLGDIFKSINVTTLEGKAHKLILVDDYDDYQSRYKKKLKKIVDISKYPVIFTTRFFPSDRTFVNGSLKGPRGRLLKVEKPLRSELVRHLKKQSTLTEKELNHIVEESLSTRSAILSTQSNAINDTLDPWRSKYHFLQTIQDRELQKLLDRRDVRVIFRALHNYDEKGLAVMERFADFDYRLCAKFERVERISGIDPWFVNHMEEPIGDVNLQTVYKEYKKKKSSKKKSKKKTLGDVKKQKVKKGNGKKVVKADDSSSLNKWF